MEKSTFTPEYALFARILRAKRTSASFTQVELAEAIGTTQSIVSKWERGELRVDLVQLHRICSALGITLRSFVTEFEDQLKRSRRR